MAFRFSKLFLSGPPPLIGVDIGAAGIRIIELSSAGKECRVEHHALEPLNAGVVRDGSIIDFDRLVDSLRRALKNSASRTRTAALALPSGSVITKVITLPAGLSEDELEMQVEAEASQSLPFAMDEISLDFGVINTGNPVADSVEVMLVAARKEKINERLALAEAAGIKPVVMDIESHAARAAMNRLILRDHSRALQPVGLFQIGTEVSNLSMLHGNVLVYEREQVFGSLKLTQDLVRFPESGKALFDAFNDAAAMELGRALQLFFTSTPHGGISHVYVAVSDLQLPGLADVVAKKLGLPVSLADPFSGMRCAAGVNEKFLAADAASSLVACGLAMRSEAR